MSTRTPDNDSDDSDDSVSADEWGWTAEEARAELLRLAGDCDRGAASLAAEAADPDGALRSRGHDPAEADAAAYQARKQQAADGARQAAERLRAQARGEIADPGRAVREAGLLAQAAQLGGFLIDGSRVAGHGKRRVDDLRALAGAGCFEHVAEPGQLPYFQLAAGHADDDAAARPAAPDRDGPDDADGCG